MAFKTIRVLIGGQKRELKFGNMAFFLHAGVVYKGDPMELLHGFSTIDLLKFIGKKADEPMSLPTGINDPAKLYSIVYAYVFAGLLCAGGDHTPEQVNEWVSDLDFDTGSMILKEGRAAFTKNISDPGEPQAQTTVKKKKNA